MNKLLLLITTLLATIPVLAQQSVNPSAKGWRLDNIDLSFTAGTTGLGFDLASPVYHDFRLRLGAAWMPRFSQTMHFDIQVGDEQEDKYDAQGNRRETKFDRLSSRLEGLTGYHVDQQVDMIGKPTYSNVHLLVDFMPFRNKNWYLTAGVFYGSSTIAEAINSVYDAPSLVGVNYYNNLYTKIEEGEPIVELNRKPIYLDVEQEEKILAYGRMGIYIGDYVDDNKGQYIMVPDDNCTVSARILANRWKPFLGIGYKGRLIRGDDRYYIGFDCGAMFWGGSPDILTHDGTNLTEDVRNVRGRVGDYVSLAKAFKVMPVLNLKLTRRISF